MAGACSCESCLGKACGRPAGGFEGFEGGQTAVLNALKCESCLGKACGRVWRKGLKRLTAGKESFNALKNRWLGRVAARVALERPAGRFGRGSCRGACEAFEAWQTAETQTSNCCWNVRAMAVTKQVPHLRLSQAPPCLGQGRGRRIMLI